MTQMGGRRPFSQILLGRPLETSAAPHQAIGKIPALAIFASDALSSVAYATEEILLILALAGVAYFTLSIPIAIAISLLLVILTTSYRQTIFAYPGGGGAYVVARDNLGELIAQTAGGALMTDYILTVAVSISAGVAQITSAFPELYPYRVGIAVGLITIMTVVNLRGLKESSTTFAIPTYFFLGMAFLLLITGLVKWVTGSLGEVTGVEMVQQAVQPLTLFLALRAFSSGCTALTGVEAISNGITAFKEPRARNAATTMLAMSGILMTMFIGITLLANQVGAIPVHGETIISQIARTVFGRGTLYLLTLAGTTIILIMAANTSFADFPRLAALQASDGFLPRQLTIRGGRLVFSWGILLLATIASLLVIFFQASVTLLIPLYAIGVFLSFTISQAGMVVRWRRVSRLEPDPEATNVPGLLQYDSGWRWKQIINAIGAMTTGIVMLILATTKFREGAWIILLLTPTLVWVFFRVNRHYREVAHQLSLAGIARPVASRPVETLVLVDNLHGSAIRAINFALSLGRPFTPLHISTDEARTHNLQEKWLARFPDRPLVILPSPYRSLTEPLLAYIARLREEHEDAYIHLILGALTTESFWEQALHRNSTIVFRVALRHLEGIAFTEIPFKIRHDVEDRQTEPDPLSADADGT